MRKTDIFLLALTNIHRRRLRTMLTVIGVVIGTICILLMISLGYSSYKQLSNQIENDPSLCYIYIYRDLLDKGIKLNDDTVSLMSQIPHVKQVTSQIILPITLSMGPYIAQVDIIGTDSFIIGDNYEKGAFYISDSQAPLIVIGNQAKNMFQLSNGMADQHVSLTADDLYLQPVKIRIGQESLQDSHFTLSRTYFGTITGILNASDSAYSSNNENAVYVDLMYLKKVVQNNYDLINQLNIDPAQYSAIILTAESIQDVPSILAYLQNWGIEGSSPIEFIQALQGEQKKQQWYLFAIGSIALIVASIGISNTMLANLSDQQIEIAILKVIGMRVREIRLIALCESGMIGFIGGLIGILLSYIIIWILSIGIFNINWLTIEEISLTIPVWISIITLFFTIGIGILAGLYPAYKASKKSVLDVLK